MIHPIRGRDPTRALALTALASAALALACATASPQPPADDASYEVLHEGFGVRADLDGWQVYQDAASAPAMLRQAFANKKGPDDGPLFVALRDDVIFTVIVRRGVPFDAEAVLDVFEGEFAKRGGDEMTRAIRLPSRGDIVVRHRLGSGGFTAYSHVLLHSADGRAVIVTFTKTREPASDQDFVAALRGIQLRGERGWEAPWELPVPIQGEPLVGYAEDDAAEEDPFEAVECAAGQYPLLWVVPAEAGGRLFLFGSIHVGHASFYPFAEPIEQAFEDAERLVVEIDTSGQGEMDLAVQFSEAGSVPAGQQLQDVVSPELYAHLGEAAKQLGLPPEMFDAMTPGTAGLVLSMVPLLARGFDPSAGVDQYFLGRAEGKEVVELESMEQQAELLESFDEAFLRATLEGLDTLDADLDALHRAWRCGDEEGLGHTVFDLPLERAATAEERADVEAFHETLLYGRNRAMARRIGDLLAAGGDSFVVVGAAHLVGEQGIPALLRSAGHPVERVGP